jgi:RNA polymerase sigma factor (sigma-70 family)
MDALTDELAIPRILNGEKELYAILVRRYNQRLYRAGISILSDDAEVEDAMQAAYIHAYENLGKFEFKSAFSTWLTRIMINECLLRIRRKKKVISMDEKMKNAMENTTVTENPATTMMNNELRILLDGAIRSLPEKFRSVFVLREIENMSVAETRECLGLTESNVKVRLNRAKSMLRDLLSARVNKEELLNFHLSRCERMVNAVMNRILS